MDFSERIFDDDFEFNDTSKKILRRYKGSDLKVMVPDSVIEIGENAFQGCISLEEIKIPDLVTSIGENAFQECISLEKIEIPDSVTNIGENAFKGCNNICIYCHKYSYAVQYAIENDINYKYLDAKVNDIFYILEESNNELEQILSKLIEKDITHYSYKNYDFNIAIPKFNFSEYKKFIINLKFEDDSLKGIDIYDNYRTFSEFIEKMEKKYGRYVCPEENYSYNDSSENNYYNEYTWTQRDWNEYYTGDSDIDCDPEDYWKD